MRIWEPMNLDGSSGRQLRRAQRLEAPEVGSNRLGLAEAKQFVEDHSFREYKPRISKVRGDRESSMRNASCVLLTNFIRGNNGLLASLQIRSVALVCTGLEGD